MTNWNTLSGQPTQIIAHRGASGYLPEHTLQGYSLALALGADVIEPDLVATRDCVLIARHERDLALTTNIELQVGLASAEPAIAENGKFNSENFTWKQTGALRARQPFAGRSRGFDAQFAIPNLAQILALAQRVAQKRGRPVTVYPELKHPQEFAKAGIDLVAALQKCLRESQVDFEKVKVWLQCFDLETAVRAAQRTQLPTYFLQEGEGLVDWNFLPDQLAGFGVAKKSLAGDLDQARTWIAQGHQRGKGVHVWTFRDDTAVVVGETTQQEYAHFFELGVDALFSDFPDSALKARKIFATGD